jgi:hypothetical protein
MERKTARGGPNNIIEGADRSFVLSPDPTALTNDLVDKAREDIRREIDFVRQILTQRLDAMDAAAHLMHAWRETLPRRLDEVMQAHQAVHAEHYERINERFALMLEKFAGVATQFTERDTRTAQLAESNEKALSAALSAAKEAFQEQNRSAAQAIAKSEAGTMKSIDQLTALFQTAIAAMSEQMNDLKGRVLLIEGRTVGLTAAQQTQQVAKTSEQASSSYLVAVIGLVVGTVIAASGLILSLIFRH